MPTIPPIIPCLWFDSEAEAAARFYVSIFPDSAVEAISHYGAAGAAASGRPPGSVMTVGFRLAGTSLMALNGGPVFRFTEAISLLVMCADQDEIDQYWDRLGAGGDPAARQCGWLKDRYGLSWQIVPAMLPALIAGADADRADRVMAALVEMRKLDIAALERAAG